MPTRVNPTTRLGEASLVRLSEAFARYIVIEGGVENLVGLRDHGRHLSPSSTSDRYEQPLVEFVAITEHFSTGRLLDLHPDLKDGDVGTWPSRNTSWNEREQIDVEDAGAFPEWPKVRGFVEARNAIQHGLGQLTRRQLQGKFRDDIFVAVASANIRLAGTRVLILHETVVDCLRYCSEFVLNLDRRAPVP